MFVIKEASNEQSLPAGEENKEEEKPARKIVILTMEEYEA